MTKILSFLDLDLEVCDFESAECLPVKGSSQLLDQGHGNVHWRPEKMLHFEPTKRGSNWKRALNERFNWLADDYLLEFGYTKKTYDNNRFLWTLRNILLDVRGKMRSRYCHTRWILRRILQKITRGEY